jgi:hypothetical protein
MIRTLFPKNDAVSQDDDGNVPFTQLELFVLSRFEEHEGELQHLPWSAQSPDLIIELLWLVLETRVRNSFPTLTSLKQLEDALQKEWYKIPLETV